MRAAAETLAARLPPLLVAAERVAATVAQGVHGRRRVGVGDSFWQFRPFVDGDSATRVDWRQSAKSDRVFVRDMEWEAAQTVCLWRDRSASMQWRSGRELPEKRERAELLLLALASLLVRAGEQIRLMGVEGRVFAGRGAVEAVERALPFGDGDLPPPGPLPRYAGAVLMGDFLGPIEATQLCVRRLAEAGVRGQLVMVLDPAEMALPYDGRVRFRGLEGEADAVVPRVEGVRAAYGAALERQQAALASMCGAAGFGFLVHRTDSPPETALLALWMALSGARA